MKRQWKWIVPLAFLGLLTPFTPTLDMWAASLFHIDGNRFYNSGFLQFFYVWGERFGFIFGSVALTILVTSFFRKKWLKWRAAALALVLTLVLGAGIIINMGFKEIWGRPRPKQLVEFGGTQEYRAVWQPRWGKVDGDHHKSFPSGHAAIGFYYLSLILVGGRYKSRLLKNSGIGLTAFWGSGLMVTRVVQGGHFVSDVLVSPVIMWSVSLMVDYFVFESAIGKRFACATREL